LCYEATRIDLIMSVLVATQAVCHHRHLGNWQPFTAESTIS
jgi:hypothetical protein